MNLSKNKLFYWCWLGGETFLAGAINICALFLFGKTITHHTGNISYAAIALGSGEFFTLVKYFSYVVLFVIGAIISGLLYNEIKPGLNQYFAIISIGFGIALLISFNILASQEGFLWILAFGMGLKNGIYIKMGGVLVRITHMTGYLSDLAFSIAKVIKGHREEIWELRFYVFSIISFFIGGLASTIIIQVIGARVVEVLAILYVIFGILLSYGISRGLHRDILI